MSALGQAHLNRPQTHPTDAHVLDTVSVLSITFLLFVCFLCVFRIMFCMRSKRCAYVKGNNTTKIRGHVKVNSKYLPSCWPAARDLTCCERGRRQGPRLQDGPSNTTRSSYISVSPRTSVLLATLHSDCCYAEKIINSQLPHQWSRNKRGKVGLSRDCCVRMSTYITGQNPP